MLSVGTKIRVLHGQHMGRCGVVQSQFGHAESLLISVQLTGEPDTTLHRMNALSPVYAQEASCLAH